MGSITKEVTGPYSCSNCGAAKPDTTTWPQDCPECGDNIWSTCISFTRRELRDADIETEWLERVRYENGE